MRTLKLSIVALFPAALALVLTTRTVEGRRRAEQAPTTDLNVLTDDLFNGFGDKGIPPDECSNPPAANRSFEDNKFIFDERETPDDGLGPVYNDVGCGACHQNPESGISQIRELRAGHLNEAGNFVNPPGGQSLIQLRALAAPIQERLDVAPLENIRTFRTTLNVIGDGFIEAIANGTITSIRDNQPSAMRGTLINVPVIEANGTLRVGRFGWKN